MKCFLLIYYFKNSHINDVFGREYSSDSCYVPRQLNNLFNRTGDRGGQEEKKKQIY